MGREMSFQGRGNGTYKLTGPRVSTAQRRNCIYYLLDEATTHPGKSVWDAKASGMSVWDAKATQLNNPNLQHEQHPLELCNRLYGR